MSSTLTPAAGHRPHAHAASSPSAAETGAFTVADTAAHSARPGRATAPCRQCGSAESWGTSEWCPQCGYHPRLGMSIPEAVRKPAVMEETLPAGSIPGWMWVLSAGLAVILGVSTYARFRVPEDGPRTIWSLAQVLIGFLLFAVSHIQAYLIGGSKTDRVGLMDFFLGPTAVWRPVLRHLPDTRALVLRGAWGASLVLCGVLVVGGLGWDEFSDLIAAKFKSTRKPNVVHAVTALAKGQGGSQHAGPESLDEAVQAFAGDAGADQLAAGVGAGAEAVGTKKLYAIVGYTRSVSGELRSVVLASGQPMAFATKLPADKIPPAFVSKLEVALPDLRTSRPCVACPLQAHWVKPELKCMIEFDADAAADDWSNVTFLELFGTAGAATDSESARPVLEETLPVLEQALPALQGALSN